MAGWIDCLHQMIRLQNDEAVCSDKHQVCRKYAKQGGRAALRFPRKAGNEGITIVNINATQSALFVKAFGNTQRFSAPALSATEFIFIIRGMIRRWMLPGLAACYDKAPVDDDPRKAQYDCNDTEHDESPFFKQLFAAMSSSAAFPSWAC